MGYPDGFTRARGITGMAAASLAKGVAWSKAATVEGANLPESCTGFCNSLTMA